MAGLVGAHPVSAFADPQNGQEPIDADQVRANDDAVGVIVTAHDADATIHIQSSILASRPAAGTAQRVWITTDGKRIYIDSGSAWAEIDYLNLTAGGTVAGAVTLGSTLTMTTAASRLIPGATSFAIRNNANSVDNVKVLNNGQVTLINLLTAFEGSGANALGIEFGAFAVGFWAAAGEGGAAAGSNVPSFKWDDEATNDQSRFLLYDQQETAYYRVKFGADNSGPGGSGRALYIDNGS